MSKRGPDVDLEGLLCALVLAPRTFARNRFFSMYQDPAVKRVRRRAGRVRGLIRQLLGQGRPKGEVIGEQVLEDGQVLLRLRVAELSFERTTALSALEAATMRVAMERAGSGKASAADREHVKRALSRLGPELRPSAD